MMDPFYARWIRVTFAGWCLGFALLLALIGLASGVGLGDARFPIGLGMGLGVGLAQRKAIRERLGAPTSWAASSALAVTLPFLVLDVLTRLRIQPPIGIALPVCVALAGLVAGIVQSRTFRKHGAPTILWVPSSVAGWTLAAGTVVFNDRLLPRIPGIAGALLYVGVLLAGGLFLGAFTGFALRDARPA